MEQQSGQRPQPVAGPSARTVLMIALVLTLLVFAVTAGAHFTLQALLHSGTDPGVVLMVRALAGSLLAMLLILDYVLGWTELFQGWRHRTRGGNIFFTAALIFLTVIGSVLICIADPFFRSDLRKGRTREE